MQIRSQLRANILTFVPVKMDMDTGVVAPQDGMGYAGYYGKHSRIRFKARSRHHGTKPGQSGRKQ